MPSFTSETAETTKGIASRWAKALTGLSQKSVWVALEGDLGAGKTTFVQGVTEGVGIDSAYYVTSPTFTMINEYRSPSRAVRVVHMDLYRIKDAHEAVSLGIEEYDQPNTLVLVEWPERIQGFRYDYRVSLSIQSDQSRMVQIDGT